MTDPLKGTSLTGICWKGWGVVEKGCDPCGNRIVACDARRFRQPEVATLLGDLTKARDKLGWIRRISFQELVPEDIKGTEREERVKAHGYTAVNRNT